jgi:small subunit ribosomal protein S5
MENNKDKKTDDILEKLVHINRITKVVKVEEDLVFQLL